MSKDSDPFFFWKEREKGLRPQMPRVPQVRGPGDLGR